MSGKVQGLNKEFQKRDVERMRNLIQGKYGEKNGTSVGFTTPHKEYKEGETWEKEPPNHTIERDFEIAALCASPRSSSL